MSLLRTGPLYNITNNLPILFTQKFVKYCFFELFVKKNCYITTYLVELKEVYSIQEVEDIGSRTWQ